MVSYRSYRAADRGRHRWGAGTALLAFLVLGLLGVLWLMWPYRHPVVLGFLLAMACHPFQKYLERLTSGRSTLAAGLSTLVLVLLVVVPTFLMTTAVIGQGILSFQSLQVWIAGGGPGRMEAWMLSFFNGLTGDVMEKIIIFYPGFDIHSLDIHGRFLALASFGLRFLVQQGGALAGNLGALVGHFFLMLLVFFVVIRHHDALLVRLFHLLPLSRSQETRIFERMGLLVRSVFVGTFMTALVQGIAGGLAFFAVGLPGIFWGAVMAFASLIPVVGTTLIWGPAVIWLFFTGDHARAMGLFLWCLVVVGSLDNFVRPLFMRGGAQMHAVLVFFSILGGLQLFGFLGLLYGPLILGLASVFLYIYQLEFARFLHYQNRH